MLFLRLLSLSLYSSLSISKALLLLMIGVYLWAGFCADVPMDSRKEGDDLLMAKQTFCLAPCSLHLMRAMQTAPAFLPLFLAVLCFSEGGEGDRRERAGEEDVAAFNFLSPLSHRNPVPSPICISHPLTRIQRTLHFALFSFFSPKISLDYLSEFINSMEHATDSIYISVVCRRD